MAAIYKISEDTYEDSFVLIALHSSMEDYLMVYTINLCLKSNLKRCRKDLDIFQTTSFPIFEWKDNGNDSYWALMLNSSVSEESVDQRGLFQGKLSYTNHHLVPEYKDVDYFLKIEQDDLDSENSIIQSILAIPGVITAYTIDTNKLKSRNNLIF